MDFRRLIEKSWKLTLDNLVPLILLTLGLLAISTLTLGILAPVATAGYTYAILMMIREGREPKIQDLFSQMGLFIPLIVFGIIVFVVLLIGFSLLVLPGILLTAAITFGCFYMLPLMLDQKLGIIDAIKQSFDMAMKGNVIEHLIVVILFLGISAIGSSVLLGTLFTQPLATILMILAYEDKIANQPFGSFLKQK